MSVFGCFMAEAMAKHNISFLTIASSDNCQLSNSSSPPSIVATMERREPHRPRPPPNHHADLSDHDSDASGEDSVATLIPESDEEHFVDDSDEEDLFGDDSPALPPPEEADHHFKPITEEPQQRVVTPQDDPVDLIDLTQDDPVDLIDLTHDSSDELDTKPCADVGDDASSDDSLLDPDRPSTLASTRPRPASKRVTLNRSASGSVESPSKERPPTHDSSDELDTKPCADVGDDASSDDSLPDPDRQSTLASTRPRPSKKKIVPPQENTNLTCRHHAFNFPKAGSWQCEVRQWLIDNVMTADDDKLSWPNRGHNGQKETIDLMMKTDTSLTERSARRKLTDTLTDHKVRTKWIVVEKTAEDLVVDAQDPTSLPVVLCDDFTILDPGKCAVFFSIGRHRCRFF
jgi:hypothetical protein